MTISKPLKWHGGKSYLAQWIINHMPPHLHYVEPYFGGGAVLFARKFPHDWMLCCPHCKTNEDVVVQEHRIECVICRKWWINKLPSSEKGCSEVVNDINGDLAVFWSVLAHEGSFSRFQRVVEATAFSEEHWDACKASPEVDDAIMRAVAFFVRYRQSRQGLGKDFATLSRTRTRRGMNEQVSSWLSAVEGLPEAHDRLKRVVILNRDALGVIKQQDGEKTLFYLDPPNLHETRSSNEEYGEYEMSKEDHQELLKVLRDGLKGKFMLSGYHSEMYDDSADVCQWRCKEKRIDNKASSAKEKQVKTECLWMNY